VLTWEDGRETWDRGYGDCKAFAWCVADLCEAKGIECWVSVVRPIGEHNGHAVTMGVWEGKLWMSSNGIYGVYESLDEALKALSTIKGFNRKTLEFIPLSLM
jgi:transglutaminase-like putative cysteine protease